MANFKKISVYSVDTISTISLNANYFDDSPYYDVHDAKRNRER